MHDLRYGQKFSLTENNVEYRIREKENIDFKTPIDTLEFRHERNVKPIDIRNIKFDSVPSLFPDSEILKIKLSLSYPSAPIKI